MIQSASTFQELICKIVRKVLLFFFSTYQKFCFSAAEDDTAVSASSSGPSLGIRSVLLVVPLDWIVFPCVLWLRPACHLVRRSFLFLSHAGFGSHVYTSTSSQLIHYSRCLARSAQQHPRSVRDDEVITDAAAAAAGRPGARQGRASERAADVPDGVITVLICSVRWIRPPVLKTDCLLQTRRALVLSLLTLLFLFL